MRFHLLHVGDEENLRTHTSIRMLLSSG